MFEDMDGGKWQFRCNACYGCPTRKEGCFTDSPKELLNSKETSCTDGTWDEYDDDDNLVKECDIVPNFIKYP